MTVLDELNTETVGALLRHTASQYGSRPFVHYGNDTITYAEMDRRTDVIAGNLAEQGVERGTHVALLLDNRLAYLDLLFALAKVGAVMVPLNSALRGDDLHYHVENSDSQVIVVEDTLRDRFDTVAPTLDIRQTIGVGWDDDAVVPFQQLREGRPTVPDPDLSRADPFAIIHTSGTTGLPKGVVLPHRSYLWTGWEYGDILDLSASDVWYTSLPLFHCNAQQATVMGSVAHGTTMALGRRFSASDFWARIERHDATVFNYIGDIITILLKESSPDRETSLRIGAGGGADADDIAAFEERYDLKLLEGYGLTETGTVATKVRPDMSAEQRRHTEGPPMEKVAIAVVDDDDNRLPTGQTGEIVVRPEEPFTTMLEYYENPTATVESWQNLWFHTGDLGRVDGAGNVQFVDRKIFTIRRRGENISSREVEQILLRHPAVDDAAVVAVEGEIGEEVKAYLTGEDVDPAAVVEHCTADLAEFKVPRFVEIVDAFERTETEKIKKGELAARGIGNAWDREDRA